MKKRKKSIAELTFKQRLMKNLGWLIASGAFLITGVLLLIILPKIKYSVPEYETTNIKSYIQRKGPVDKIKQITKMDNLTYEIVTDNTYIVTLSGINISEGYSIGDNTYNADCYDISTALETGLYFEKENYLGDNKYTGYIWFTEISSCNIQELQNHMFNAMLIYANFADYNNEDVLYAKELKELQNKRPELNDISQYILDKLFSIQLEK